MKKFAEIAFSGIIGVILTLAYQIFFEKPPVFIINGQEVNATEETYLELSRQKDELQNELDQLQDQYSELGNQYNEQTIKYNELTETYNELTETYNELITNINEENQTQELATNENEENQTQESKPTSEIGQRSISIRKVNEFYSDGIIHSTSNITDNIGNSYEGYTFMSAGDFFVVPEGSVVYRNNSQYSHFYGRVIVSDYDKDAEDCGWIKIYGDDILLFDSGVMGRGIIPVDFNLEISNYNEIRIDFKDGSWSSQSLRTPNCYLVDTYFVEI